MEIFSKPKKWPNLLGVSEHRVRVRTMQGVLPHVKLGHLVRYELEKIEGYLARRRQGEGEGEETQA